VPSMSAAGAVPAGDMVSLFLRFKRLSNPHTNELET
jgi:hypothetical protein